MIFNDASVLSLCAAALLGLAHAEVQGFDISDYQPNVNYQAAKDSGARFVIIKVWIFLESSCEMLLTS